MNCVVLDHDDLVTLNYDLPQLFDLIHQNLHVDLLSFAGVTSSARWTTRVFTVKVWQLLIDLVMIRQYLADPIEITAKKVLIRGHFKRLAPVACRIRPIFVRDRIPAIASQRACMLQVCCHQFLILLERASIATHLHGKQWIAHSIRILACIRRRRSHKRLWNRIITRLLHDLRVVLAAIGRRSYYADLIVDILG